MNSNYGLPAFYSNTRQGEAARDVARHESENSALENPSAGGCGNGCGGGGCSGNGPCCSNNGNTCT